MRFFKKKKKKMLIHAGFDPCRSGSEELHFELKPKMCQKHFLGRIAGNLKSTNQIICANLQYSENSRNCKLSFHEGFNRRN